MATRLNKRLPMYVLGESPNKFLLCPYRTLADAIAARDRKVEAGDTIHVNIYLWTKAGLELQTVSA